MLVNLYLCDRSRKRSYASVLALSCNFPQEKACERLFCQTSPHLNFLFQFTISQTVAASSIYLTGLGHLLLMSDNFYLLPTAEISWETEMSFQVEAQPFCSTISYRTLFSPHPHNHLAASEEKDLLWDIMILDLNPDITWLVLIKMWHHLVANV